MVTELSFGLPKLDDVRGGLYLFESLRDTGSMNSSSDVFFSADLDDMASPQISAKALETSVDSLSDLTSGKTVVAELEFKCAIITNSSSFISGL